MSLNKDLDEQRRFDEAMEMGRAELKRIQADRLKA
jgi:hypothetical protein